MKFTVVFTLLSKALLKNTIYVICCLGFIWSATAYPAQEPVKVRNGESMQSVEAKLGSPEKRKAAVGEPAIIRWEYKDQTVYFEEEQAIHSVKGVQATTVKNPK